MKNLKFFGAALIAAAAISCNKSEGDVTPSIDLPQMTISAYGDSSRTIISGTDVLWSVDDKISLHKEEDGSAVEFTSDIAEAAAAADFTGDEFTNDGGTYYALYPHNSATTANYSAQTMTFTIADTQTYNTSEENFAQGAFASVAKTTDLASVAFTNLMGGVKIELTGEGTVTNIEVTTTPETPICGTATIDMSLTTPEITTIEGGDTITLDCGEGVALDETTPAIFMIALPPTSGATPLLATINFEDGSYAEEEIAWDVVRGGIKTSDLKWDTDDLNITTPAVAAAEVTAIAVDIQADPASDTYYGVYLNSSITLTGTDLDTVESVYVGDYEATIDAASSSSTSLTFAISDDYTYTTATAGNAIVLNSGKASEQTLTDDVKVYPMYYYEDVTLEAKSTTANTDGKTYTSTAIAFNLKTGKTMSTDELQALEKYVCGATHESTPSGEYLDIDPYILYAPSSAAITIWSPNYAATMMGSMPNSEGDDITDGKVDGTPIIKWITFKYSSTLQTNFSTTLFNRTVENLNDYTSAGNVQNYMRLGYNMNANTVSDFFSDYYDTDSYDAPTICNGITALFYYDSEGTTTLKQSYVIFKSQTGATCAGSGEYYKEDTSGKSTITMDIITPKYNYVAPVVEED